MKAGRRHRTPDPTAGNKSALLDLQLWFDGVDGAEEPGWGAVIYREDVKTFNDLERALDEAFTRLKAKAYLALRGQQ